MSHQFRVKFITTFKIFHINAIFMFISYWDKYAVICKNLFYLINTYNICLYIYFFIIAYNSFLTSHHQAANRTMIADFISTINKLLLINFIYLCVAVSIITQNQFSTNCLDKVYYS